MSGDKNAVVVDIWLLRAFGLDRQYKRTVWQIRSGGATVGQYDMVELYCRELAELRNLEPREVSAMVWSGVRILTTGDRETHYQNILRNKLIKPIQCYMIPSNQQNIFEQISAEIKRADKKHGNNIELPSLDNSLKDRTPQRMLEEYDLPTTTRAKYATDNGNEAAMREELIQLGAVVVKWIRSIDCEEQQR